MPTYLRSPAFQSDVFKEWERFSDFGSISDVLNLRILETLQIFKPSPRLNSGVAEFHINFVLRFILFAYMKFLNWLFRWFPKCFHWICGLIGYFSKLIILMLVQTLAGWQFFEHKEHFHAHNCEFVFHYRVLRHLKGY
jgi:hypothetical protein